jgi:outer membrane protein assembly factor BamB
MRRRRIMKRHPRRLREVGATCAVFVFALALADALSACAGSSTPTVSPSTAARSPAATPSGGVSGSSAQPVLLWKFKTREFPISATPAVTEGVVCARGNDGYLYALDAQSGKLRWRFDTRVAEGASDDWPPFGSSPAASGGLVYVPANRGARSYLYALDAQNGEVRWKVAARAWAYSSSPAVADGVVYFDGYALDADTGHRIWETELVGVPRATPGVGDGLVCIRTTGYLTGVRAVDAQSGKSKWFFGADINKPSTPAVASGVVYLSNLDGLYALDGQSGQVRWSFHAGTWAISSPAVGEGVVYFSNGNSLYAVDIETHRERWTFEEGPAVDTTPAVADGVVYFGSDGQLYALDAQSGEARWSFALSSEDSGSAGFSTPIVADGVVYVGGEDGYLYAVTVK